jgi:hypothetical protein
MEQGAEEMKQGGEEVRKSTVSVGRKELQKRIERFCRKEGPPLLLR